MKLSLTVVAAHPPFSGAVAFIMDRPRDVEPLMRTVLRRRMATYTDTDLSALLNDALAWSVSQDRGAAVAALTRDYPLYGSGPLHHLAALAVLGRTEDLSAIRERFDRGDKSGFLPYLDTCHVRRAETIARGV